MAATFHLQFQCLLGMACRDFAMVAADQMNLQSIVLMKDDEDKLYELSDRQVLGLNGDVGDRSQLSQLISKNLELYLMRNRYRLGTAAITHFTRKNMNDALQNGTPYIVNVLMAGFDEEHGAQLYYMDFLATCLQVPFASHGFGGLLALSILSKYYRPDLTEAEAYGILNLCVSEIHKRLYMNIPNFCVKTVSKDGIKVLPIIRPTSTTYTELNTDV